jgi:hypothetical protein
MLIAGRSVVLLIVLSALVAAAAVVCRTLAFFGRAAGHFMAFCRTCLQRSRLRKICRPWHRTFHLFPHSKWPLLSVFARAAGHGFFLVGSGCAVMHTGMPVFVIGRCHLCAARARFRIRRSGFLFGCGSLVWSCGLGPGHYGQGMSLGFIKLVSIERICLVG